MPDDDGATDALLFPGVASPWGADRRAARRARTLLVLAAVLLVWTLLTLVVYRAVIHAIGVPFYPSDVLSILFAIFFAVALFALAVTAVKTRNRPCCGSVTWLVVYALVAVVLAIINVVSLVIGFLALAAIIAITSDPQWRNMLPPNDSFLLNLDLDTYLSVTGVGLGFSVIDTVLMVALAVCAVLLHQATVALDRDTQMRRSTVVVVTTPTTAAAAADVDQDDNGGDELDSTSSAGTPQ
mmetsp:Transcript_3509/g.8400  ORF Transcript_3509/g.8400 Transcript_3509/m.8400 type:complete len:240 (+) Transcript_3509:80-799(+)|eukprot:CAMPEP_0198313974 /NCGR_PEP_ID=MMETSP1450-20131203/4822_1 /TAXON_ID=753684 ORGANISM="Madagascaria erythrocladiodes, Strain CCMP3234" /NCGR_SAMPLE_ID=MMETSP1450 /ASSEMBLY_ACC=CAM_ASM_001115 /LENGTH=239 /DNA_ID=CAMNT_0044017007 /DNA_START=83 /DNA_END=802 /DNA_ORIENTATION=-